MPTKTDKTYAATYPNDLAIDQSTGVGIDSTTRKIQDGLGNNTSMSASDDVFSVQPVNDDTTGTMLVKNKSGSNILSVDTTNSIVKVGSSQVHALTLYKEMGLYDFSPTAGYHYPLIANTMFIPTGATAFAADNDWGNGTDPATTLDVSGLTAQENAIAVYWYLENAITIDSVRYMVTADGSATLNFHLFKYTLDTTSEEGDLSAGEVEAIGTVDATADTVKTGTLNLGAGIDIAASKVVVCFVENEDNTSDISVSFNIKYHIQ